MSQQIKLCIIYIVWIYWLIIKLNKDLRKMKQYNQNENVIKIFKNLWKTTQYYLKLGKDRLDKNKI